MLKTLVESIHLPKNLLEMSNSTIQENLSENWSGAVCVICVENSILYIKRSESMPTHKGQLAFIGGHKNAEDKTPADTAFRELEEELGLSSKDFSFKGLIPVVKTSSKHIIVPVLLECHLDKETILKKIKPNSEWTNLYLVPFSNLLNPTSWSYAIRTKSKSATTLLFCAIRLKDAACYNPTEKLSQLLWGATARMTWNLLKIATKQGINTTLKE
jgi:8-oxo-dGTP pyrophosphatase MutT (NUDIX family)